MKVVGGCMVNRNSGAKARFIEMAAAYFLKLKNKQLGDVDNGLGVARPAP